MKNFKISVVGLLAGAGFSLSALAADFTQDVSVSGNTATINFNSSVNTSWVDVHYQVNGGALQNLRMLARNGHYEQPVADAGSGTKLDYSFTYTKDSLAYDSGHYSYTVNGNSAGGNNGAASSGDVCFFEHTNFQGASFCASASSAWVGNEWNDRISSLKVVGGKQVQLFEHSNQGGRSVTLTGDVADLSGQSFNDQASSFNIGAANNGGGGNNNGGGNGADYTVIPGFIGIDLKNNTRGVWRDDQVYITVIAINPANNRFSYLKPDGTIIQLNPADNDGPGHLSKGGSNYSNYSFTLAQSKSLKLPKLYSGRIFVSNGAPMHIKTLIDGAGNVGFAGPNPLNSSDANNDIYYDWYEFTYNDAGLWINTTQVDQFGFPLLLDVWGDSKKFHMQVGITDTRDGIYQKYAAEVPGEFRSASSQYRIMARAKAGLGEGQASGTYLDGYASDVWNYYRNNTLTMDMWGGARRFSGRVQGDQFVFTEVNKNNGAFVGGTYTVARRPNTQEILEGRGVLAQGNSTELAIEAQLCAALNRRIATDVGQWTNPSAWYKGGNANFYAKFWHDHSVGALAYGFAYDDVSEQSSTVHTPAPEHMSFGIGW